MAALTAAHLAALKNLGGQLAQLLGPVRAMIAAAVAAATAADAAAAGKIGALAAGKLIATFGPEGLADWTRRKQAGA